MAHLCCPACGAELRLELVQGRRRVDPRDVERPGFREDFIQKTVFSPLSIVDPADLFCEKEDENWP